MSKKPSIIDRIANAAGYIKSVALSTAAAIGAREYPSAKSTDMLGAYISWVYACVKARSRDVSRIQLKLYKVTNYETGEVEEVAEHDVLSLLRSVNPFMTPMQLFEHTQSYKDLTGEAFWYLQRAGKNGTGIITQIWILRPDYMDIKTSVDGFISGYVYKVPGQQPIDFKVEEIIHFKEFNPINPYRGMGVVRAAAVTIDSETYAEEYNKKFFRNSAIPEVVLTTEQKLSPEVSKRMHAEWGNKYGGTQNAHKTAILEGGLDIKTFSISQKDMEFLQGMGFSRDKILALFEVPKSRLGMTEGVTVSNAEATINIYLKYCVKPLMEGMRDVLNEGLLKLYEGTEDMFFEIEDPVPADVQADMTRLESMFRMGSITPNEVRGEQGFDEVDGLDGFYLPINQSKVADEKEGPVESVAVTDENGKAVRLKDSRGRKPKVRIPAKMLKDRVKDKIAAEIKEGLINAIGATMPSFVKTHKSVDMPEHSNWQPEMKEAFWKQLVGKSESYEKKFLTALIPYFDRQETEVLERLATANGEKAVVKFESADVENILISVAAENKIAVDILIPIIREVMEESAEDTLDFLGSEDVFDAQTEAVKTFLRVEALKGIRVMNKVTKSKLRKQLRLALQEGLNPVETARNIRGVFNEAKTVRALRVARTETLKAANRGALEAYKQSGVVVGKEWFTSIDERVCEWCGPMHGRVIGLNQDYFNKDESFVGNQGGIIKFGLESIPTPPLHPNCRCTLIPVTLTQQKP